MGFGVRSLVRSFYEITILAAAAAAASPTKKLEMLIEVAEALRHLHEHHTVHGHLHPANIFYTKGGGAVVADPSLHMFSRPFMLDRMSLDSSIVYQPREALDATQTTLEASADVYAFSSIIYAVMTGNPPLKATSAESIKDSMCEITFFGHTRVSKPEDMLPKLWDIVQKCWSVNAAKRPSMQVVIDNLEMIYFYGFNSKEDEYDLSW
ncbi:hypothetical protein C0991_004982 [Blastosporella zonata]|nr:hypothetical protein C0991_004982 [Blastosporella zonata]